MQSVVVEQWKRSKARSSGSKGIGGVSADGGRYGSSGFAPRRGAVLDEVPIDASGVEEGVTMCCLFSVGMFRGGVEACFAVCWQADEGVLEWLVAIGGGGRWSAAPIYGFWLWLGH